MNHEPSPPSLEDLRGLGRRATLSDNGLEDVIPATSFTLPLSGRDFSLNPCSMSFWSGNEDVRSRHHIWIPSITTSSGRYTSAALADAVATNITLDGIDSGANRATQIYRSPGEPFA